MIILGLAYTLVAMTRDDVEAGFLPGAGRAGGAEWWCWWLAANGHDTATGVVLEVSDKR
jgi:hypothetical protein